MAFPLGAVLAAAPGIISAAADIIKVIRDRKKQSPESGGDRMVELETVVEQQAVVIEELAINNRNLAIAVRNNRIISIVAMVTAAIASVLAVTS